MAFAGLLFPILGYFFIALWGLLGLLKVAVTILTHPFTALKKTTRESEIAILFVYHTLAVLLSVPPACLLDPALGSHEYVTANGLKFHCVCAGDTSKPLMLLLHGFPEVTSLTRLTSLTPHISHSSHIHFSPVMFYIQFWFSWRHQLKAFSKDYHVVAVDMRSEVFVIKVLYSIVTQKKFVVCKCGVE